MDFTVFSKDGCPYCDKIIELLETANQRYVVYKLDREFTKDQFYEVFGEGSMFPQVQVDKHPDGKRITLGGCMDTITFLRDKRLVEV